LGEEIEVLEYQPELEQRNIRLSENSLERLNEGVRIAREKGMNDTLIIVDDSAFVVNAGSSRVITSLSELRGRAITNIDGTVIV
jgi:flagellar operon protein